MKKITALLLSVLLFLLPVSGAAFAEGEQPTIEEEQQIIENELPTFGFFSQPTYAAEYYLGGQYLLPQAGEFIVYFLYPDTEERQLASFEAGPEGPIITQLNEIPNFSFGDAVASNTAGYKSVAVSSALNQNQSVSLQLAFLENSRPSGDQCGITFTAPGGGPIMMENQKPVTYAKQDYVLLLGQYDKYGDVVFEMGSAVWPVEYNAFTGEQNPDPFQTLAVTVMVNNEGRLSEVDEEIRNQIISGVFFTTQNNNKGYIYKLEELGYTNGRNMCTTYLSSVRMDYDRADVIGVVTLWDESIVELRYSIGQDLIPPDVQIDCAELGIDTEEELNELLASLSDVPKRFPEQFAAMDKEYGTGDRYLGAYVMLKPGVNYGDIVFETDTHGHDVILQGYGEEGNAQMNSLTVTSKNLIVVDSIDFSAETETTGIKRSYTPRPDMFMDYNPLTIMNCSFSGYETALDCGGMTQFFCSGSLFNGNTNDVCLDCSSLWDSMTIFGCAFVGYTNALTFSNVCPEANPYLYNVNHCEFFQNTSSVGKDISVTNDIDNDIDGDYSFNGNYFDHEELNLSDNVSCDFVYYAPAGLKEYLLGADKEPEWGVIGVGKDSNSVTVSSEGLAMADGTLVDTMILDGTSFEGRTEDLQVQVMDGKNCCGFWIFEAEEVSMR